MTHYADNPKTLSDYHLPLLLAHEPWNSNIARGGKMEWFDQYIKALL